MSIALVDTVKCSIYIKCGIFHGLFYFIFVRYKRFNVLQDILHSSNVQVIHMDGIKMRISEVIIKMYGIK